MAAELWLYRADTELLKPVRVQCPDGRYPASDADGKVVYENTHFVTERQAWECLLDNAQAGVSLAGGRVKEARQHVLKANEYAADMALEFETVRDRYNEWQGSHGPTVQDPMDFPQGPAEEPCDE